MACRPVSERSRQALSRISSERANYARFREEATVRGLFGDEGPPTPPSFARLLLRATRAHHDIICNR